MTAGDVYTIAGNGKYGFSGSGGPATGASFAGPGAVAVDHFGNAAIADGDNSVVWVTAARTGTFYGQQMAAGNIYVVAGHGTALGTDGLGDSGPATASRLSSPAGWRSARRGP
jgi:hypothetical protein